MSKANVVYLPSIVGGGYKEFWNCKKRYRVCKGSRGSKKSATTALWYITNIIKYPNANLLVLRKTYSSLENSCYTQLKWACNRLGVTKYFEFKKAPLEIIYKPTGQRIIFRGLDKALKLTSITVTHGYLCWVWVEECYEIESEDKLETMQESIRGKIDAPGAFKQITITFNP